MNNFFNQNELTPKRWLMLAGGPESFGGGDEPVNKQEKDSKPSTQEQRSQLSDLAGNVEANQDGQVDQNEGEQGAPESTETTEDAGEIAGKNVAKTLGRTPRQKEKLDMNQAADAAIGQRIVEQTPDSAAIEKMENSKLSQDVKSKVIEPTRQGVLDLEPGALA
jgi:hypothetical protein